MVNPRGPSSCSSRRAALITSPFLALDGPTRRPPLAPGLEAPATAFTSGRARRLGPGLGWAWLL